MVHTILLISWQQYTVKMFMDWYIDSVLYYFMSYHSLFMNFMWIPNCRREWMCLALLKVIRIPCRWTHTVHFSLHSGLENYFRPSALITISILNSSLGEVFSFSMPCLAITSYYYINISVRFPINLEPI